MKLRPLLDPLLDGQFICQTTEPALFSALQNAATADQVNTVLHALGFDLSMTQTLDAEHPDMTGVAYYAAYRSLQHAPDHQAVSKQLHDYRDQIAPMMDLILLLMKTQGQDGVFMEGDTLRFNQLLNMIEDESTYQTDLKRISQYPMFNHKRVEKYADILSMVLSGLHREGYLQLKNKASMIYVFTGKITHFYHCIDFILQHEDIPIDEEGLPALQQGELTL